MSRLPPIRAVVPVKQIAAAKQRLAPALTPTLRQALARAMLEDVLAALAAVRGLDGVVVVTLDADAAEIAARNGAAVWRDGAGDGHSVAIAAAARTLAAAGTGMLALPSDIPLLQPEDVERVLAAPDAAPAFAIVPARDGRGSNAVLCAPADAVPLAFGDDSFRPHLAAARARGIAPAVLRLPRIALDIDHAQDLAAFLGIPSRTRTRTLLEHCAELEMLR